EAKQTWLHLSHKYVKHLQRNCYGNSSSPRKLRDLCICLHHGSWRTAHQSCQEDPLG
ncbi:hypothetical protein Nmel_002522, partial [Mimus melanotis]